MTDKDDGFLEITIEEMVELIRQGESVEVLYEECPFPKPNIITLICKDSYCRDIRELKPILSAHSSTQILIRSHDKDNVITAWKEFFVHSANIYMTFKVSHNSNQITVEQKTDESQKYESSIAGKAING